MTVATGYRPRPWEAHLRLASALTRAPARVAVDHADDGWACAHLAVCGRVPIWASRSDPRPVHRSLLRLGLPPLGEGEADALLGHDLRLRGGGRAQRAPGLVAQPVDILTTVGRDWREARGQLRTLLHHGRVIVVDRTGDPRIRALLERMPGVRALHHPGLSVSEALGEGLDAVEQDEVLVVPEGCLLLPGALPVLRHALERTPGPAMALGDQILLDSGGGLPLGLLPAPRLSESAGAAIVDVLGPDLPPVLIRTEDLRRGRAALGGGTPLAVWLSHLAPTTPTRVVPLWTAGRTRPLTRRYLEPRRPALSVLPEDAGLHIIIDDGDEGALGETLEHVPAGARLAVLRAVPHAADSDRERLGGLIGGYGDLEALGAGPWHLRLTSDPSWQPPPLRDPELLREAPLDLPDAAVAIAAALDWPLPHRRRAAGRSRLAPEARLARDTRRALREGDRGLARTLSRALLGATGSWEGCALLIAEIDVAQAG